MNGIPFSHDIGRAFAGGITQPAFERNLNRLDEALADMRTSYEKSSLALLRLPERTEDLPDVEEFAAKFRDSTDVVFLGTGGSSLGGQTLAQLGGYNVPGVGALQNKPRLHFLDNLDPLSLDEFLSKVSLGSTKFVAISKSGGTGETLVQTIAVIDVIRKSNRVVANHVYGITEPAKAGRKNGLRTLLERFDCEILNHDTQVGGRFIALTNVGLLPALLAGVDIHALRAGARELLAPILQGAAPVDIAPAAGAALSITASESGLPVSVLLAYGDRFERLTRWWMQLWGESLGKDGKGSTPVGSIGPVDQHSQLQLWLAGPKDKFFTVLSSSMREQGPRLDSELASVAGETIFAGRPVGALVAAQCRATADTLAKHSRPLRLLEVQKFDSFALGAVLMHFMLETIFAGHLLGVNPYDQPAVEEGKILAKKYLAEDN